MRAHRAILLPLFALSFASTGCPTDPAKPPRDVLPPEDEWSKIPPSKEWLYATSDFSGPHKAECDHVLAWVKGEDVCKATLCEHGRDLGAEWMTRCKELEEPAAVGLAKGIVAKLTAQANEAATDCGKELEVMVRDGCGQDATCLATGQRWATRCGKTEGTPLVMRILQRTLERKQEQGADPVQLDPRTCDELRADAVAQVKCKDRFVCADATPRVQVYRDRCETASDRPTIPTAVAELTVIVGGNKPGEPILVRQGSPAVVATDVPVALVDGSGGIISVCEERASDLARYIESRKTCQGGKMVVARAFPTSKGVEVLVGALDFPDDATFSARYPTVLAFGEQDRRDQEEAAALGADLDKAVHGSPAQAAAEVTRVVLVHALGIRKSPVVRAALTQRDAALVPALREIGKLKAAAAKNFHTGAADAAGLIARAPVRAFADLGPDGAVNFGAQTRGLTLDTAAILPQSMEAYLSALKGIRPRKLDARTAGAQKAQGTTAAQACGAAEKKLQESKKLLVSCNVGLEKCDPAKHAELAKAVDDARFAAEAAFRDFETARTADAADADDLAQAATGSGCREPWW
jgi:hypothetical protein